MSSSNPSGLLPSPVPAPLLHRAPLLLSPGLACSGQPSVQGGLANLEKASCSFRASSLLLVNRRDCRVWARPAIATGGSRPGVEQRARAPQRQPPCSGDTASSPERRCGTEKPLHPCSDASGVEKGEHRPLGVCVLCAFTPRLLCEGSRARSRSVCVPAAVGMAFQELKMHNDLHSASYAVFRMHLILKQPLRSRLTIPLSPYRLLGSTFFPYVYLCLQMAAFAVEQMSFVRSSSVPCPHG